MKLTVLIENTAQSAAYHAEHGLSLFIEVNGRTVLFDMGQTAAFARNADALSVPLDRVDTAVLSHGHYDHGGGVACFLRRNDHAAVYLSRKAFGAHYHGPDKYIGLDPALAGSDRLRFVDDFLDLGDGLTIRNCTGQPCSRPVEAAGLTVLHDGVFCPETFDHEQYLLIREGSRRIVISGCAHKGVVNVARWFDPDVLIGGFHLSKLDPADDADRSRLDDVARSLLSTGAAFYTGHCTGEAPFAYLKEALGDRLHALHTGMTIDI